MFPCLCSFIIYRKHILHKSEPVYHAHVLNATYLSHNATLFAKGCYFEEWCSLCKVILQVMFPCLFSFIIYRKHILHKSVPIYHAHVLNATYLSHNATLFAKGCYFEEWCSLCKVILQVMFPCLFSFIIYRKHILHKSVPVYHAHVLNATYLSHNATLFAKGCYFEEWCSLCKVILQVMFPCLFSFIIYRKHILHKSVPVYHAHVLNATYLSHNATLFAKGCYFEEWCSLSEAVLQVQFANLCFLHLHSV